MKKEKAVKGTLNRRIVRKVVDKTRGSYVL